MKKEKKRKEGIKEKRKRKKNPKKNNTKSVANQNGTIDQISLFNHTV